MSASSPSSDSAFGSDIARIYERDLVPLIFEPYADVIAERIAALRPARVLEVAAGTGVVTRAVSARVAPTTRIVATDLNQAMLDQGAARGTHAPVEWQRADAMALPFEDSSFELVVCQFGMMFFPDKARAIAEARRVLRVGGLLLFSVWDRIEENEFADTVTNALVARYPEKPPLFLARTPHGYFEHDAIARDMLDGGFESCYFETMSQRSIAHSAQLPAVAYCMGTPLRNEIEAHGPGELAEATAESAWALRERFGSGRVEGKIQAHIITAIR